MTETQVNQLIAVIKRVSNNQFNGRQITLVTYGFGCLEYCIDACCAEHPGFPLIEARTKLRKFVKPELFVNYVDIYNKSHRYMYTDVLIDLILEEYGIKESSSYKKSNARPKKVITRSQLDRVNYVINNMPIYRFNNDLNTYYKYSGYGRNLLNELKTLVDMSKLISIKESEALVDIYDYFRNEKGFEITKNTAFSYDASDNNWYITVMDADRALGRVLSSFQVV